MQLALRVSAVALACAFTLTAQRATGLEHLARKDWSAAKSAFEQAVRDNPHDADSHIGLGVALWGVGDRTAALTSFRRAVEVDPQSADARFNVAVALRGLDEVAAAREQLEAAVRLSPNHERSRIALGLLLQQQGDADGAIAQYREILKHNPSSADAHNWLGVAYLQKKSGPEAIAAFREAIRLQDNHARAWNNLGSTLARTGEPHEAIRAFEAGLKHAPEDPQLLTNSGISLRDKGWTQQALKQFEAVAQRHGATADLQFQIAQTLRQSGDLDSAVAAFGASLQLNPEMREAYYGLGATLKQLAAAKRPRGSAFARQSASSATISEALRQARLSIASNDLAGAAKTLQATLDAGSDAQVLTLLGFVEGKLGSLDRALEYLRKAVELKANYAEAHYQLGVALWYKGQLQESKAALDKALQLDASLGEAWAFRGMMARRAGDFTSAVRDLQAAIALAPALAAPYIDLGTTFLKLGRTDFALGQFEAALNLPGRPVRLPDVDVAIAELRTAASREPRVPELHNTLGRLLGSADADPKEVISAFQEAIRLRPEYPEAWNHVGLVHLQTNDDPSAISAFRKAVQLRPDYAEAYSNLGGALTAANPSEAVKILEKAVRLKPDLVNAQYNLALAYGVSAAHGAQREIAQLRKVIGLQPDFGKAHFALGRALLRVGDAPAAVTSLQEAIRLDPKHGEAHYQLGLALSRAGRRVEGAEAIRHGRELVTADQRQKASTLDMNEGRAALNAGNIDSAVSAFNKVVREHPDAAEAHHYLGLALTKRGDVPAALAEFRRVLELDPAHPTARINLEALSPGSPSPEQDRAEIERHIRESRFGEAERILERRLATNPKWAWGWYALGYARFGQQRLGDSIKALARSLELDITNAEAHNLLGRNLMMAGRFDAAQVEFQEAAKRKPDMAEARYNLGQLFSIQDNWAEARRALEDALRIKPDYTDAHNALGFALEALGEDEAAMAAYLKAIELTEAEGSNKVSPYVNLSAFYNKTHNPDAALKYARRAVATHPQSDRAWFQIGRAWDRKGDASAAADALVKAVAINNRVATYHYVLGNVLRKLGRIDESRAAMERFRQLDRESTELERKRREALRAGGTAK